ncbi:MAG: PhnD/SsuA/transferrin family substrate-binding protein [Desulfobacterales bacterium]|nr:PhnD/SsuA/transferrin family substrate-binding protein [Desulfobacterales bacterium]
MNKFKLVLVFLVVFTAYGSLLAEERILFGASTRWAKDYYPLLFEKVKKEIGLDLSLVKIEDYDELDRQIKRGKINIAHLSPIEYVRLKNELGNQIQYFLTVCRGKEMNYESSYRGLVVSKISSEYKNIDDLKSKIVGYKSKSSGSGYIYPIAMIKLAGFNPETHFSKLVKLEDGVLQALDAGSIQAAFISNSMFNPQKHQIIGQTDPIPLGPWIIIKGIDEVTQTKLKKMLMGIPKDDPVFIKGPDFGGFIDANDAFYDSIRKYEK